jgi:hypothetical protein
MTARLHQPDMHVQPVDCPAVCTNLLPSEASILTDTQRQYGIYPNRALTGQTRHFVLVERPSCQIPLAAAAFLFLAKQVAAAYLVLARRLEASV